MRAGTMRFFGSVQKESTVRDDHGSQTIVWIDFLERVSFSLDAIGGQEIDAAGAVRAQSKFNVVMRWRDGVMAGMRLAYRNRVFSIISANDPDGKRRELDLLVIEGARAN